VRHSPRVHALLEAAYDDFHSRYHRGRDPVSLVHAFSAAADREAAALIAALLAYGNVKTILASATRVLDALAPSPRVALERGDFPASLHGFRHRFTSELELRILFAWLGEIYRSLGSLEAGYGDLARISHQVSSRGGGDGRLVGRAEGRVGESYLDGTSSPGGSPLARSEAARRPDPSPQQKAGEKCGLTAGGETRDRLERFVQKLTSATLPRDLVANRAARQRQLRYLLPLPSRGSACKRLNMFLRWVVRPADGIDLGLWRGVPPASLILPIDTHLLGTVRFLGWSHSRQATWKVAEAATARLRLYCPEDPIRYDFALCHLSMSGGRLADYWKAAGKSAELER